MLHGCSLCRLLDFASAPRVAVGSRPPNGVIAPLPTGIRRVPQRPPVLRRVASGSPVEIYQGMIAMVFARMIGPSGFLKWTPVSGHFIRPWR